MARRMLRWRPVRMALNCLSGKKGGKDPEKEYSSGGDKKSS